MRRTRRDLMRLGLTALVLALSAVAAAPAAADDHMCATTRSSTAPFYAGPSASKVYDWLNISTEQGRRFNPGFPIPDGLLDGDYVPQGIALWNNWDGSGEDVFLISAYHESRWDFDDDPDGPSAIFGVIAGTPTSLGRALISTGHVGGVAVIGSWIYVGNGQTIRRYRATDIRAELEGANTSNVVDAVENRPITHTASFLGREGDSVWAGTFTTSDPTPSMYRYDQLSSGALSFVAGSETRVPQKAQGLVVTDNYFVFSTSYGQWNRSNIWVVKRPYSSITDSNSFCFRAPTMSEGLTTWTPPGGSKRLYVLYESAASTYLAGPNPDNVIDHAHWAKLSDVTGLFGSGD